MPRNITVSFEDGTQHVYENAPDDITPEAVIARASKEFDGVPITNVDGGRGPQPEELPSRTGGDIAKDIGVTAGRSGISALQQVEGLADLLPGVNATKYLSEHGVDLGKAKEYLQENASPQQQQAYKNLTEAKGAGNILSAAIENPSAVAELVGENIIPMLTGGAEAKLLTKGVPALAKYAPSIGEGFAQMGQEAQKLTAEAPDKELSGKGELAAIGSGALDAVIGRFAGKLISKAGGTNVEDTLYGTLARDMGEEAARNPNVVKRVLVSTLGEGAEEALQGGQERIWDNYAKGATNLPTLLEGAVDDATLGSILGTVMGGGAAVMGGKGEQAPAPEVQPEGEVQPTQPTQTYSDRDRKVDMENGLELAGVTPEDHPELYAELSDPKHYQSEESINALDERLKRYKSEEAPKEGEEGIDFASALPKEFDDTAWEAHLEKQREYARQTAPAAEQPQAENVAPQPEPISSVATSDTLTEHNVESLQPHLTPEMRRLVENGKLTLHDTMDTLPGEGHPENVQGLTTPQGEVHLVANKLTPESLPKVAMHEMGVHVGMRGMVGDKVWGDLTSQALTTKGEAFDRARQAVPENTPEHLKGEETLAYLVENAPNLPIVKRAISAVKNWARTTFGAKLSITESDIHHLATKALRRESKTSERSVREGTAFSYVGKKAKGADTSALARATKMEKEGVDSESIRKDTGWFLGHDDNWRFEVDDSTAGFKQDFKSIPEKTALTIGEVFDNPELFKQYPDAANITFEVKSPFSDWSKSSQGWYDEGRNKIVVTPYAEDPRSTILHEMQHWVQAKEGFAPGGNYNSVKDYDENLLDTLEKHIRNDANKNEYLKKWEQNDIGKVRKSLSEINILHKDLSKLEDINSRLDKIKNSINEKMKSIESKTRSEYEEKYKSTKDRIAKNRVSTDALREEYYKLPYGSQEREQLSNRIDALDDENNRLHSESLAYINPYTAIRELNSKYEGQLSRLRELKSKAENDIREHSSKLNSLVPDAVKHKVYQLISGEVESRDVEARKDLTPKQRKETAPYSSQGIAKEDAIILTRNAKTDKTKSDFLYSVAPNSKLQEQVEKDRQGMRPAAVKKKKGLRDTLGISAKNMQDKADLYETKMVSHDARFVNSMRRTLQSMGLDPNVIGRIMDRISQAQTVNESSVAAEAALRGDMKYDKDTEFFVAVDKTDNVVSMRQLMEDAGKAEGWSEYETNRFFTTYMVSKRLQEMYKKMHSLKVEANKQTDPAAKSALYKQSRELKAKLDLESLSEEDCNKAIDAYKTVDGFVKAEKMWHKIRENVIGTLVDSGLYSKEKATAYFDAAAYAPMWRIMTKEVTNEELDNIYEDMATGAYKTNISSLTKGMRERSYKGSKRDVFNMMDNVEHWVQLSNSRAIRAKKATDLIDVARRYLPEGSVSRLYGTKTDKEGAITCYFHGKKQYWKFEDPLMALAFTGIPAAPLTFKLISDVSNFMRDTIVLAPTFTIAQLPQDIYSAAFSTGIKNPAMLLKDMVVEFGLTAFSKDKSQTHDILKRIGAVGSKDAYADSRSLHVYDTAHHTHLSSKPKGTLRKTKDWLEQFAMAGDNAIRQAVYKRTMKELEGDPRAKSIAYQRAFDVINFRRRGASAKLEQLRSMTPFMGAALQAQRAAFQVLAGRGLAYQSSADNKSIRKRLLSTSMVMMVSSLLYNMLYGTVLGDDEDKDAFNKGDIHERDTHIMVFGGNSPVSVPIRPDIFALPFITGNHLFHGLGGDENPKQTLEAYRDAILSASGINIPLVPPAVKEPVQLAANYDFYTGRPIVAERLQGKLPEYQYDEKTSELGKLVGKFGVSPVKFDHMAKGIFGGVGTAVLGVSNISNLISDNPTKDYSAREIARMIPSMSGLVPKENFEQATDTYYSLDEEVRRANNTYNALVKDGKRAEAKEFKQEYKALLDPSVHQRMNHIKTELDKNHQKSRQISNNKNLSSEDKTAKLNALKTKERRLLSHVQTLYDKVH